MKLQARAHSAPPSAAFAGVKNAVAAVKGKKGTKLTVVSALALDQQESKGYKMTNNMGGVVDKILDYKLLGEDEVRKQLKDYTIIRPGVLLGGKGKGPEDIELNIGDTIGGGLTRDELANVVVASLSNKNSQGKTVEVYRVSNRQKLMPNYAEKSGKESRGGTWEKLWDGI